VIYGAVTNAVTGWTKQLSALNNGELSIFTKTSAGDSSIAVTNNAAGYDELWEVYEYYSGTTYLAGVKTDNGTDTFPALTGLSAVDKTIFACKGRAYNAGTVGADTTWTSPWVEDADLVIGKNTYDGAYLTVGRQINVTATSITPAASTNYTSGSASSRELAVFALNVAVAPVSYTATIAQNMPVLTQSVTADATVPPGIIQTLPVLTQTATAEFSEDSLSAWSASQSVTMPTGNGVIVQTLPRFTQASEGYADGDTLSAWSAPRMVTTPLDAGVIVQQLPRLTQAVTADATSDMVSAWSASKTVVLVVLAGTITQSLPRLTQALLGQNAENYFAVIVQTLPAFTQALPAESEENPATRIAAELLAQALKRRRRSVRYDPDYTRHHGYSPDDPFRRYGG
jgi:hypothetical protein